MENFILGIQAIARGLSTLLQYTARHDLFWGFAIGFFVSTLVHALIITENPRKIPSILAKPASESFAELVEKDPKGTYRQSYARFRNAVQRTKFLFSLATVLFFIVVLAALLRY
jgi:hypothetical protein